MSLSSSPLPSSYCKAMNNDGDDAASNSTLIQRIISFRYDVHFDGEPDAKPRLERVQELIFINVAMDMMISCDESERRVEEMLPSLNSDIASNETISIADLSPHPMDAILDNVKCINSTSSESYCLAAKGYLTAYFQPPLNPALDQYVENRIASVLQIKTDSGAFLADSILAVTFEGLLPSTLDETELAQPKSNNGNAGKTFVSALLLVTAGIAIIGTFLLIKSRPKLRKMSTAIASPKKDFSPTKQVKDVEATAAQQSPIKEELSREDSYNSSEFSFELSEYLNDLTTCTKMQSIETNSLVDSKSEDESCRFRNFDLSQDTGDSSFASSKTFSFDPATPSCDENRRINLSDIIY